MNPFIITLGLLIASYHPAPPPRLTYEPQVLADPILMMEPVSLVEPVQADKLTEAEELAIYVPPKPQALRNGPGGPNDYVPGQCTYYVKQKRPDLPPSMGNANQWATSAQLNGMQVSNQPVEGAVGVSYDYYLGHVVYVESVNPDGTVNISEMNYNGPWVISYRTTSAAEFVYIY